MENDYLKEILEFIRSFYPISESVFEKLYDLSSFKKLKPNERVLDFGQIPDKIFLINKGVMRSYIPLDNGKEVTKSLFTPMVFFASFKSLLNQEPSNTIYEALTDCDIYEINYMRFADLCKSNIEVLMLYTKFLEFLIHDNEEKFVEFLALDAKDRYLKLRERIPNVDNLIAQYQIASYLNITPVQLSRIRAKL